MIERTTLEAFYRAVDSVAAQMPPCQQFFAGFLLGGRCSYLYAKDRRLYLGTVGVDVQSFRPLEPELEM
jgi:hypothetical protein